MVGCQENFPNAMSSSTVNRLPWEIVDCYSVISLNRNWIATVNLIDSRPGLLIAVDNCQNPFLFQNKGILLNYQN